MSGGPGGGGDPGAAHIRIVSGNPDDTELAALTAALAVLAARPRDRSAPAAPAPAAWLRSPVHAAPASWTAAPPRA